MVAAAGQPQAEPEAHKVAARTWARSVFGAPFFFDKLITSVKEKEEVLTRIATEIHRRDIIQERVPAPQGYQARGQRIDPKSINPWAMTPEQLRQASETLEACKGCGSRGVQPCSGCGGAGRTTCASCNGSGKDGATSCATCRGAGSALCAACQGRATVTCTSCAGTRQQLTWFTFRDTTRIAVTLEPMSAVVDAFPSLGEGFLGPDDLAPFRVLAQAESPGRIPAGALPFDDHEKLQDKRARLDPRTEVVAKQQYARFSVLWREMTYEMCGMRGVVEQWGDSFSQKDAPETVGPIRRRVAIWFVAGVVLLLATLIEIATLRIGLPYFRHTNSMIALLAIVGFLCAVVFTGGFLRALRPGKLGRLRLYEIGLFAGLVASIVLTVMVKQAGKPTLEEAKDAVHAGDFARAKVVMDALTATGERPEKIHDLEEEMAFIDAQKASGDDRLSKMEAIASGGGHRAADAAADVRQEKLRRVHMLVTAKQYGEALDLIDKLFPSSTDSDVLELKASQYDAMYDVCTTDPCRYTQASKASKANGTPQRLVRTSEAKLRILRSLTIDLPPEPTLARLQRLRALDEAALAVTSSNQDDAELRDKARAAAKLAMDEREKIPVLGADLAVAEELLGKLQNADGAAPHAVLEGIAVYLSLDKTRHAIGLYVTGADKDARAKGIVGLNRPSVILSKALGHTASVPPAGPEGSTKDEPTSTSWRDGKVPITARWRNGTLVELRIGDAAP